MLPLRTCECWVANCTPCRCVPSIQHNGTKDVISGCACAAAGEALYPHVLAQEPQRAGKITGMLLELSNDAVLHLLATPAELSKDVSLLIAVHAIGSHSCLSNPGLHTQLECPSVFREQYR